MGCLPVTPSLSEELLKEKGAGIVAKILRNAEKPSLNRLICVINLGEIIYMTKRRFGDQKKPESLVYKAAEL